MYVLHSFQLDSFNYLIDYAKKYEKKLYHQLGGSKKRLTETGTEDWRKELKVLLSTAKESMHKSKIPDSKVEDSVLSYITSMLGYNTKDAINIQNPYGKYIDKQIYNFMVSKGIQSLIDTIENKRFKDHPKILTDRETNGLKTELGKAVGWFLKTKTNYPNSEVIVTSDFNKGAYSEGALDIVVKLNKEKDKKETQIRAEIKNYTKNHKIGTIPKRYLRDLFEDASVSIDKECTPEPVIRVFVSRLFLESACIDFLTDQYEGHILPFKDDSNNDILLFSEYLESFSSSGPAQLEVKTDERVSQIYRKQIQDINSEYLDSVSRFDDYTLEFQEAEERWRNRINSILSDEVKMYNFHQPNYTLWYAKRK